MPPTPIPSFANEQEEAEWWDAHPDALTERFQIARQQGAIRVYPDDWEFQTPRTETAP